MFGDSAVGIRLGAVLLSIAGSLAIYRLGARAFGDPRAGFLAVVGLQITPLFWAGSLLLRGLPHQLGRQHARRRWRFRHRGSRPGGPPA